MTGMRTIPAVPDDRPMSPFIAKTGHKARAAHAVIDLDAALKRNEK
jgi:hypothetical protein